MEFALVYTWHIRRGEIVKASKLLLSYIEAQGDKDSLAKRLDISRRTLYSIENGEDIGHADVVAAILKVTGYEFDKAFEV